MLVSFVASDASRVCWCAVGLLIVVCFVGVVCCLPLVCCLLCVLLLVM